MATFNDLPVEILSEIFSYIGLVERQRLEIICKRWQSVIRLMWRTIHKLQFLLSPQQKKIIYRKKCDLIADELNWKADQIWHLENILKLFNGNLRKLFYRESFIREQTTGDYAEMKIRIFNLIRQNKCLTSVRLHSSRIENLIGFIKCIPTQQLQHLSIESYEHRCDLEEWTNVIENVLVKIPSMKYLELRRISLSMVQIICKMDSLESLHLRTFESSPALHHSFLNIAQLSNLESLSLWDCELIDDDFMIKLAKNCKKLSMIDFQDCRSVTHVGWRALETLPNLRCVDLLSISRDTEIFNHFSNLTEFYCCMHKCRAAEGVVLQFLHRSPELKKYHFYNNHINALFHEIATKAGFRVEDGHTSFHTTIWNQIFRAPS